LRRDTVDGVQRLVDLAPIIPVKRSSPTIGKLIITFAAAPWAAAALSRAATSISLVALTLLRPAVAAISSSSRAHSRTMLMGASEAALAAAAVAAARAASCSAVSWGSFRAAEKPAYARASSSARAISR